MDTEAHCCLLSLLPFSDALSAKVANKIAARIRERHLVEEDMVVRKLGKSLRHFRL